RALTKAFARSQVLKGLELEVRPGEAVALWGDNGAGKSTTIKCILGLLHYTGEIQVAGLDAVRDARAVRCRIGYVPQELSFYSDWDARKTMRFYAQLKRAPLGSINGLLASVGLADHAKKPVAALSGGMKQRLALAIALLGNPALLLLDEFTSNLDAQARAGLLELLHRQRNKNLTVLFTSHRVDEVQMLADRVLVMQDGLIGNDCAPAALAEVLGFKKWMYLHFAVADVATAQRLLVAHGYTPKMRNNIMEMALNPGLAVDPLRILMEHGLTATDIDIRSHRDT
ncbi:MAG: ABC transporter ATP-binding protein, partial [Phycisphaerae bacterium]